MTSTPEEVEPNPQVVPSGDPSGPAPIETDPDNPDEPRPHDPLPEG